MRSVLFLGQKPLGEKCFQALAEQSDVRIAGVCSNDDANEWWGTHGIKTCAQRMGISFINNSARNESLLLDMIKRNHVDCLISVQHRWILSSDIIESVSRYAFNLHAAPLPSYKGYNACNHAILNGETTFAATLHWMAPEVDAGDAAFVKEIPISHAETAASLYKKTQEAGFQVFLNLLEALSRGISIPRTPLKGESKFYSRSSLDTLRRVNNPGDMSELDRKARAFWFPPFEPAFILANGRKYHLYPETAP